MKALKTPTVSIIIPVHNEGDLIYSTIESIHKYLEVPTEIIVIDDASTDSCCDFLRSNTPVFENVKVLSQTRAGIAQSRNRGAKEAKGDVLIFLDAHCCPQPKWIDMLLSALEKNRNSILTPCLSDMRNTNLRGYGAKVVDRTFRYRWLTKQADTPYEIPIAGGGCMIMTRDFFNSIGCFDNMRVFGIEDVEICIRCWLFGYSVVVVPNVEVAHLFREKTNFPVGSGDYLHNVLRTAVLHFDGERLCRILEDLEGKTGFSQAAKNLLVDNLWERYAFVRKQRQQNADWFCEKFAIEL